MLLMVLLMFVMLPVAVLMLFTVFDRLLRLLLT
jgi:hypothetical protein